MPNFRDLFPNLFPARFAAKAAARAASANKARDNAFESFQRLLRDKGYVSKVPAPSSDVGDEPARDTQDHPSTNPKGVDEKGRLPTDDKLRASLARSD